MSKLLDQLEEKRVAEREALRAKVRVELVQALREFAPCEAVIVFGSLAKAGCFHSCSDVDIAFCEEPRRYSLYTIQAKLEERLGRTVDLVLLSESRFRLGIESAGEKWTNLGVSP